MALILIAGQSNALGYGNDGPAPYVPTYRVQVWTGTEFNYMDPGRNTGTAANPHAWGPEVAIAKAWLAAHPDPAEILYIGKVVKGSTPLAQDPVGLDWSPASHGELFDQAAKVAHDMRSNLGVPTLDAVFWMQGEQDATRPDWAAAYGANLEAFTHAVRADWIGDSAGYIGVGRIGDGPALPYGAEVRLAEWQLDQVDDRLASFRTIGFERQADGLHLDAAGQLRLGQAFYDAWAL